MEKENRSYFLFYTLCLALAAFCLRAPINSVGPVVSEIKADLNMSSGIAGMLTTIPLLLFSFTAFFAGAFLPHFRVRVSAAICFILALIGSLCRSYLGLSGLYIGTVLIGLGIGTLNVMLPALNREKMAQKIGIITGLYNVCLNIMAGCGSGFSVRLSQALGSWRHALAVWAVFPLLAIPLWQILCRKKAFADTAGEAYSPIAATRKFLSGKTWLLAILMAVQSFIYFSLVAAWLPSMLKAKGISAETAGLMTMFLQLISLAPAFLTPVNAVHPRRRPVISIIGGASYLLCALIYLCCDSLPMMVLCCICGGIGSGSCYSYVLALITLSGKNPAETTWTSGFVQMFGYFVSALGPTLFGLIIDASGTWTLPMLTIGLLGLLYVLFGILCGRSIEN